MTHDPPPLPETVRTLARAAGLTYAGDVPPKLAWEWLNRGHAVLVDVRTIEERQRTGYVPGSLHVVWSSGIAADQRFVAELEAKTGKDKAILLMCRSGGRSRLAAHTAANAGFTNVFNILEGCGGNTHDSIPSGWRGHRLPWVED